MVLTQTSYIFPECIFAYIIPKQIQKMKKKTITIATGIIFFAVSHIAAQSFIDPETAIDTKPANNGIGSAWSLDFSDEFNGTLVNTGKWNIDNSTTSRAPRPGIGILSWFWKPANVAVSNGNLILKVTKETDTKMHCGSINSNNKYLTTYGYFEARIKIADAAKGTHTAFWLQGPNMSNVDGTGNDGAEIDIFESAWTADYTKSVIHIDGYTDGIAQANTKQYNTPGLHNGNYHTWGMWWTYDFIKIYYDGVLKVTYDVAKWIPRVDEFLWLSDGASFGFPDGDPCFTSQPIGFLTEAYVDYIRVWKPQGITTENAVTETSLTIKSLQNKQIQVEAKSLITSINIYDTMGRLISSQTPESNSTILNFNNTGVYLMESKLSNGTFSRNKLIVRD